MARPSRHLLPLWHYTPGTYLSAIVASRELRPTSKGIDPGERPAVWFSAHQGFEPTAGKGIQDTWMGEFRTMTMEEMHDQTGIARIGVHPATAPINWPEFKRTSGVSRRTAQAMARFGNPLLWFASYEPVPMEKWVAVEVWNGEQWVDLREAS